MGQRDLSAELGSILNGRVGIYSQGVRKKEINKKKNTMNRRAFWLNSTNGILEGRSG